MKYIIIGRYFSGKYELRKELGNIGWSFADNTDDVSTTDAVVANPDEFRDIILENQELVFTAVYIHADPILMEKHAHEQISDTSVYEEIVQIEEKYSAFEENLSDAEKMRKYLSGAENCSGFYKFENHFQEGEMKNIAQYLDSRKNFFINMRPILNKLVCNGVLHGDEEGQIETFLEADEKPHMYLPDSFSASLLSDDEGMAMCMRELLFLKNITLTSRPAAYDWSLSEYIRNIVENREDLVKDKTFSQEDIVARAARLLSKNMSFKEVMDRYVKDAVIEAVDILQKEGKND